MEVPAPCPFVWMSQTAWSNRVGQNRLRMGCLVTSGKAGYEIKIHNLTSLGVRDTCKTCYTYLAIYVICLDKYTDLLYSYIALDISSFPAVAVGGQRCDLQSNFH